MSLIQIKDAKIIYPVNEKSEPTLIINEAVKESFKYDCPIYLLLNGSLINLKPPVEEIKRGFLSRWFLRGDK